MASEEIRTVLDETSAEVKKVLFETLKLEKRNLHYERPPRINDEIEEAVREIVR
jgi:hypothetical protein